MQALRFRPWWIAGGVVMALAVVVASLLPAADLPQLRIWDKFEHAFAYFALAAWFGGVVKPGRYAWLAAALLGLGIAVEIAQGTMAVGRTADLRDVFANGAGVALGLILAILGVGGWMQALEHRLGVAAPIAD